jgi:hypothetical protein
VRDPLTDDGIAWVEEIVANKIARYDPMTGAITETSVPTPLSVPNGDGPQAASLIRSAGLAGNPVALANIIYQGGLYSVAQSSGNACAKAVAYAFPHSGVTLATATTTFVLAGFEAGSGRLTAAETQAGLQAIVLTYAAYALNPLHL